MLQARGDFVWEGAYHNEQISLDETVDRNGTAGKQPGAQPAAAVVNTAGAVEGRGASQGQRFTSVTPVQIHPIAYGFFQASTIEPSHPVQRVV